MIQTNYIPSEHPYVAIYHKGRLGLLIGIMIESIEMGDNSNSPVMRKSHPVVSYNCIKEKKKIKGIYSTPFNFKDTDVWWDVDINDVLTIGVEGGCIEWDEFFEELAPIIKKDAEDAPIKLADYHHNVLDFVQGLTKLNIKLEKPQGGKAEYNAYLYTEERDGLRWCITGGDIIIECVWDGMDEDDVYDAILKQLTFYGVFFAYMDITIIINFDTDDEDEIINESLSSIAQRLNTIQQEKGLPIIYLPQYLCRDNLSKLQSEGSEISGIEEKTILYFSWLNDEEKKDFLKDCICMMIQHRRKKDGTKFFEDAIDWIGIYLVVTGKLGVILKKGDFEEYAKDITPKFFPEKGKIKLRTMTNFAAYTNENNIGNYRRTMEVHDVFWDIVKICAYY